MTRTIRTLNRTINVVRFTREHSINGKGLMRNFFSKHPVYTDDNSKVAWPVVAPRGQPNFHTGQTRTSSTRSPSRVATGSSCKSFKDNCRRYTPRKPSTEFDSSWPWNRNDRRLETWKRWPVNACNKTRWKGRTTSNVNTRVTLATLFWNDWKHCHRNFVRSES